MNIENIFIEQAEYLEDDLFNKWNTDHPDEKNIISKLSQNGAKLITGPRGCGKTTLMLKTYHTLAKKKKTTLGVYVNFKTSLKIEPLYKKNTNASYWFNQWLMLKIYKGIYESIMNMGFNMPTDITFSLKQVDNSINQIELGLVDAIANIEMISITQLQSDIHIILDSIDRKHCVLLLDDAAHAFSEEQQRDFFEFFRQIKNRSISPKAAIYPGITNFSATFHVGHDAEEINVWIKPEQKDYYNFMLGILEKRLPEKVFKKLCENDDFLAIVIYSCFGIPRSLLNTVRSLYKSKMNEEFESIEVTINKQKVLNAVNLNFQQTFGIFRSLKVKLPIYRDFIINGENIYYKIIENIKEYNKNKDIKSQSVTIAIKKPLPPELTKVLGFLQYAGLIMDKNELSKGEKGVFELYNLHYAALVEKNAFQGKKAINSKDIASALMYRDAHSFKRVVTNSLLDGRNILEVFSLSLPPCNVCGQPRISEHSKFCGNCGSQLKSASIFEELVSKDIDELPLTEKRVKSIKDHSRIKTIKDLLMDTECRELRGVPQIGPYWAEKIFSYAEEYIG